LIDFHCHLDLYPDPALAAEDADRAGIYVLSVTTAPKAWQQTSKLAAPYRRIRTALGLHPEIAHERLGELPLFEALAGETPYFGEIGLDGSPAYAQHQDAQIRVFDIALRSATTSGGKVMTIHSRRAADGVLDMLKRYPDAGVPILHWFSGTASELRRAISQGCWFSVGPAMLRSQKGRALASAMPRDRVLTETDGPFAMDRSRPLQPADAWVAVEGLAKLWECEIEIAKTQLAQNLRMLTSFAQKQ
jgi:TatD DNase family protein